MKTYRVAIIGTGAIANSHIQALQNAGERVEIVAAVDVDEARVKAFCAEHHIPHWYTNSTEMLSAIQTDLVHILTPPGTHFDLIMECLQAGAWVYCEKPLCASLAQFDQITDAEARTGCCVSTVFQWRFGSAVKHLKQLIDTGEMGRPLLGVCQTLWYRDLSYYQVPWRGKWKTETGGATVIMGIHLMDLFLYLYGNWNNVQAMVATMEYPVEVDTVSMALVRFENGAMGNITTSAVSPRQESYLRLDFQRATVDVTALYRYTNQHWRFSIPDNSLDEDALKRWKNIQGNTAGSHNEQLADLLDTMDQRERPLVSGLEARRIIEFIASMYKSGFTGETVERGSITSSDPFYHAMNGQP